MISARIRYHIYHDTGRHSTTICACVIIPGYVVQYVDCVILVHPPYLVLLYTSHASISQRSSRLFAFTSSRALGFKRYVCRKIENRKRSFIFCFVWKWLLSWVSGSDGLILETLIIILVRCSSFVGPSRQEGVDLVRQLWFRLDGNRRSVIHDHDDVLTMSSRIIIPGSHFRETHRHKKKIERKHPERVLQTCPNSITSSIFSVCERRPSPRTPALNTLPIRHLSFSLCDNTTSQESIFPSDPYRRVSAIGHPSYYPDWPLWPLRTHC